MIGIKFFVVSCQLQFFTLLKTKQIVGEKTKEAQVNKDPSVTLDETFCTMSFGRLFEVGCVMFPIFLEAETYVLLSSDQFV